MVRWPNSVIVLRDSLLALMSRAASARVLVLYAAVKALYEPRPVKTDHEVGIRCYT